MVKSLNRAARRRSRKRGLAAPKLGERRRVVPAGNAPASSGYQPDALLLSYETISRLAEGVGNAPTSARADPVFKTGAASLYLPAFPKCRIENTKCRIRASRGRMHFYSAIRDSAFCI